MVHNLRKQAVMKKCQSFLRGNFTQNMSSIYHMVTLFDILYFIHLITYLNVLDILPYAFNVFFQVRQFYCNRTR